MAIGHAALGLEGFGWDGTRPVRPRPPACERRSAQCVASRDRTERDRAAAGPPAGYGVGDAAGDEAGAGAGVGGFFGLGLALGLGFTGASPARSAISRHMAAHVGPPSLSLPMPLERSPGVSVPSSVRQRRLR